MPLTSRRLATIPRTSTLRIQQCPYCGAYPRLQLTADDPHRPYVGCLSCEARGPSQASPRQAVEQWNLVARAVSWDMDDDDAVPF